MNAYSAPKHPKRSQLRAQRVRVSMEASIVSMNAYQFPELADISYSGAKVRGPALPPKGTTVLLKVGGLEVLCRVVWVRDEDCGLRFEETVSPRVLKQLQMEGAVELETVATAEAGPPGLTA